jgi:hypothetical protein
VKAARFRNYVHFTRFFHRANIALLDVLPDAWKPLYATWLPELFACNKIAIWLDSKPILRYTQYLPNGKDFSLGQTGKIRGAHFNAQAHIST